MVASKGWIRAACLAIALGSPGVSSAQDKIAVASREDAELVATLIRSTLIGLHQANVTGNYTVLRDLGSPAFRAHNTAADLGIVFAPVRRQGVDLESVAVLQPKLDRPPTIDSNNRMVIKGTFDAKPKGFAFELIFDLVGRTWLPYSVSISVS